MRQVLNHIQKEEQEHGEEIYNYMNKHGMYN
ncbi:spore coat protein [Intestinibacter bartlettii]